MSKTHPNIPTFDALMNPCLKALHDLGGSANIEEIYAHVVRNLQLTPEQLELLHDADKGSQTEIEYRLAWARTYLKKIGFLENSRRGVWSLTALGKETPLVDPQAVKRAVLAQSKPKEMLADANELDHEVTEHWRDQLMRILLHLTPDAFERLIQRLLRESGFVQVEVTGKTGDGGIDGKGILRIGGLMSFHVIFQCKRYRGSVGASEIRNFRGSMVGRTDKGLFVTTGNFTTQALQEATRDGAPTIDLLDGDRLVEKLKELEIGVKTVLIEQVQIDEGWFSTL